MTCVSYQAMGSSDDSSKRAPALNENKKLSMTTTTVDTGDCLDFMSRTSENKKLKTTSVDADDCLDFMTCICIHVPYDTVLNENIELPESLALNTDEKVFVQDHCFDDGRNSIVEDTHILTSSTHHIDSNYGYGLTHIVEDPPIHFAKTDRHYGCCPLGHQETIYFKEATPIM
eukprot:scaffold34613_cov166-Amphora_coffeaeformis.AAC.10